MLDDSQIKSVGASGGMKTSSGNMGMITSGAISGLTDIATGLINANRTKNIYKFNAGMSQLQGRLARLQADVEIKRIRQDAQDMLSSQRAAYAKAGVAMTGSPLEMMMQSMKDAELDIIYSTINADLSASSFQVKSGLDDIARKSTQSDMFVNIGKTILTMANKQYVRG